MKVDSYLIRLKPGAIVYDRPDGEEEMTLEDTAEVFSMVDPTPLPPGWHFIGWKGGVAYVKDRDVELLTSARHLADRCRDD